MDYIAFKLDQMIPLLSHVIGMHIYCKTYAESAMNSHSSKSKADKMKQIQIEPINTHQLTCKKKVIFTSVS